MRNSGIIDFVERLRAKPEHVRHRIAIGTTAGVTGVVAASWLITLLFSGTLALNTFAPAHTDTTVAVAGGTNTDSASAGSKLLGAAAAAVTGSSSPATLTAVGATTSPIIITNTENSDQLDPSAGSANNATPQTSISF